MYPASTNYLLLDKPHFIATMTIKSKNGHVLTSVSPEVCEASLPVRRSFFEPTLPGCFLIGQLFRRLWSEMLACLRIHHAVVKHSDQ